MRLVESLDDYYEIIRKEKAERGRLKTNDYMFPDAVKRYINLKRLWIEKLECGLVFLSDEERFFQGYYYIDDVNKFEIDRHEKPILIQNIYKLDRKKDHICQMDISLEKSGFKKEGVLRHAILENPNNVLEKLLPAEKISRRIMEKEGFKMMKVHRNLMPELLAFRDAIKEIPFYQQPFFSADELVFDSEKGLLTCVIDAKGSIQAARHLIMQGNKSYGWIGVAEKYKGVYGLASMLMVDQLKLICQKGILMCSWVEQNNTASLQYHERLGTKWTGTIMDEWILYGQS